ncbi:MAG: P-type conjugative transfer protein TrbG [Hyphomonadaceae bacterium]|nr:P-type conjugative transfer protein TrbG [Hyphomonadaceae bacterium]
MTRPLLVSACLATLMLASPALAQPNAPLRSPPAMKAATRGPGDASLVGALHEFAYERGALYAVQASPQRITDIALEPGETLLSVSAGDTTRWIVGDAQSGIAGNIQSHILVKPNAANLATNLVIMTDRRVYHVDLKSTSSAAMASVAWRYPVEMTLATSQPPAPPPAAAAPPPSPVFTPETLNLRYRIDGDKPDWRPLSAFDDGKQVYIEMPDNLIEAPPLSVIGDEGLEAVNYRIRGKYYIVDRLFKKAELRLGSGWTQKRVVIIRQTPIAAVNTNGGPNG